MTRPPPRRSAAPATSPRHSSARTSSPRRPHASQGRPAGHAPSTADGPPRLRRSLSHLGGSVDTAGDASAAKSLAHAIDVRSADAPLPVRGVDHADDTDRQHVHGFHTYPARMHPETASRLVETFSAPGSLILDPFCGSGTVLVEAMLLGRNGFGTDINPLAVDLARLKTRPLGGALRESFLEEAAGIAETATDRRTKRAGATKRYLPADTELFDPHVLLELDSLQMGISVVKNRAIERALAFCLSAILVKVSRKQGDTSEHMVPRRIAAGYTTRLFSKKCVELAGRMDAFAHKLPEPPPKSRVEVDDASILNKIGDESVDAVITSPPYVGTYDYIAHHAMRLRWLGYSSTGFLKAEIGARRRYSELSYEAAIDLWSEELERFLWAAARAMRPRAPMVLLIGDSAHGRHALRADEIILDLTKRVPFLPIARASQDRPHFHRPTASAFERQPRREHALLLERRAKL